jgi:hypothetical protein
MPFVPCPSCSRHVRDDARACPFCDAAFEASLATPAPRTTQVGRLLLGAGVAAVVVGTMACYGGPPVPAPEDAKLTDSPADVVDDAPAADTK